MTLAVGHAAARGRAPLRQPQRRAAVCVPADIGHEPAALRLPLSARRPAATEPRHQGNARTGRRGREHDMKLLLGGPVHLPQSAHQCFAVRRDLVDYRGNAAPGSRHEVLAEAAGVVRGAGNALRFTSNRP